MDPSACFTVSHHTIAPKVRSALRQAELPLPNQSQGSRASQSNTGALALTGSVAVLARHLHRQQRSRRTRVHAVGPVVAAAAAAAKVAAAGKFAAAGAGAAGVAAGIKTMSEGRPAEHRSGRKPKVLVLGTGWGSVTFLQGLSEDIANYYDITVDAWHEMIAGLRLTACSRSAILRVVASAEVSPRNFFLYTPLLPASTMGSIEERSIVTPIRRVIKGKADFLEAKCEEIDIENKTVKCTRAGTPDFSGDVDYEHFPADDVPRKMEFNINYDRIWFRDILIYGVGAQTNTFRTPGVEEHAFFFKELSDARKVREKVTELFERASLPTSTEKQKKRWLSFVLPGCFCVYLPHFVVQPIPLVMDSLEVDA
eukprot:s1440_g5.t1